MWGDSSWEGGPRNLAKRLGLGLWGASFSSLVRGTTGCALIATDICRSFVARLQPGGDRGQTRSKSQQDTLCRVFVSFWCLSPLYILIIDVRPVWLVLTVSALMVVTIPVVAIPVVAIPLLVITNPQDLMGRYRNGWWTNSIIGLLVFLAIFVTLQHAAELFGISAAR